MWITLTRAKFQEKLTGAEYSAVKSAALGAGQVADTLMDEVLSRVTQEVRGHVSGCVRNLLGAEGTIPDELEDAALAMALVRFLNRLPSLKSLLSPTRTDAAKEAGELMKQVAACRFGVVQPTAPASDELQASGAGMTVINKRTRTATRSQTAGLL
jgi:hypothetical protein